MNFTSSSVNLLFRNYELQRVCKFIIYLLFTNNELNRMCKLLFRNNIKKFYLAERKKLAEGRKAFDSKVSLLAS